MVQLHVPTKEHTDANHTNFQILWWGSPLHFIILLTQGTIILLEEQFQISWLGLSPNPDWAYPPQSECTGSAHPHLTIGHPSARRPRGPQVVNEVNTLARTPRQVRGQRPLQAQEGTGTFFFFFKDTHQSPPPRDGGWYPQFPVASHRKASRFPHNDFEKRKDRLFSQSISS